MTLSLTSRFRCLLASSLLLLSLGLQAAKSGDGCLQSIRTLYIPIASEDFLEPLFDGLEAYLHRLTGCAMTSKVALSYKDFVDQLKLDTYDLVLAPAYSVQALAHRLGYRPLVATEKLFSARLISHQSINEEELLQALVGNTLYTPDVLSGVFMALEQWLLAQDLRYRVRLAPGYPQDHLIKAVSAKQMDFAAVVDAFVPDNADTDIQTIVYLSLPLGPLYLLYSPAFDPDLVQYLQTTLLNYDSAPLRNFLKTKRLFVPASTYPSSFFLDINSRFTQLMTPDFLHNTSK